MNVKQLYFDFLAKRGAKEKIQAIIRKDIDEWKQQQAFEWVPGVGDFGDVSGELRTIWDKGHAQTIGDVCKTDTDVLLSYSGNSEATYCSGCGLRFPKVAEEISRNINRCLDELCGEFILKNADALFEEYGIEHESDWTEDDIYLELDEAIKLNEGLLNFEWMQQTFPEYETEDDYIFSIL